MVLNEPQIKRSLEHTIITKTHRLDLLIQSFNQSTSWDEEYVMNHSQPMYCTWRASYEDGKSMGLFSHLYQLGDLEQMRPFWQK